MQTSIKNFHPTTVGRAIADHGPSKANRKQIAVYFIVETIWNRQPCESVYGIPFYRLFQPIRDNARNAGVFSVCYHVGLLAINN